MRFICATLIAAAALLFAKPAFAAADVLDARELTCA